MDADEGEDDLLIRLLEMVALLVAVAFVYQALRPHPLRRIPWRWRVLGLREPQMARALQRRKSMVRLLLAGQARDAHGLMADVDRVLASMVAALEARSALASLPGAATGQRHDDTERSLQETMGWLQAAHGHLCDIARAEIDSAAAIARSELQERTDALRIEVESRQELEAMLNQGAGISHASADQDAAAEWVARLKAGTGAEDDPTRSHDEGDAAVGEAGDLSAEAAVPARPERPGVEP